MELQELTEPQEPLVRLEQPGQEDQLEHLELLDQLEILEMLDQWDLLELEAEPRDLTLKIPSLQ